MSKPGTKIVRSEQLLDSLAQRIEFFGVILDFLDSGYLMRLVTNGELQDLGETLSKAEKIVVNLDVFPDQIRGALLGKLILSDIDKLNAAQLKARIANIKVFLNDLIDVYELIKNSSVGITRGKYRVKPGVDFKREFTRNISTGLTQEYKMLKAYFSNNTLVGTLLRDPARFMAHTENELTNLRRYAELKLDLVDVVVMLENNPMANSKLDDMYLQYFLNRFVLNVDGILIDLSDVLEFLRISSDSKFYNEIGNLTDSKVIDQQVQLFIGDKFEQLVGVMMRLDSSGISEDQMLEVIKVIIPIVFKHYIVVPKDRGIPDEVLQKLAQAFKEHLDASLDPILGDYETQLSVKISDFFDQYIDDFILGGKCIINGDVLYDDIPVE